MSTFVNYLVIGVVVGLLLDMLNSINPNPEQRFENKERFWIILVWPIAVLTFVYHFAKSWFNND